MILCQQWAKNRRPAVAFSLSHIVCRVDEIGEAIVGYCANLKSECLERYLTARAFAVRHDDRTICADKGSDRREMNTAWHSCHRVADRIRRQSMGRRSILCWPGGRATRHGYCFAIPTITTGTSVACMFVDYIVQRLLALETTKIVEEHVQTPSAARQGECSMMGGYDNAFQVSERALGR